MAVFFVPAAVGVMAYTEVVSKSFMAIVFGIAGSTVLTIITVALIQQKFENRRKRGENKNE
jgi:putative effector of murein hydrolase LrgA (UPF0299 family)